MVRIDWGQVLDEVDEALVAFRDRGVKPTLRTLFYYLVSKAVIPNTTSSYKGLSRQLVKARKEGYYTWDFLEDKTRVVLGELGDLCFEDDQLDGFKDSVEDNLDDLDNDKIYELVLNAKNPTVSRTDYYLYFNGDTTNTNYYAQWMWVEGTRVSCARTNKPYLMELGSGTSGIVICKIIRAIDGMARYNASATMGSLETIRSLDIKGSWITSANVTSIRIQSEIATAIAANSKVYLMRLSK